MSGIADGVSFKRLFSINMFTEVYLFMQESLAYCVTTRSFWFSTYRCLFNICISTNNDIIGINMNN